MDRYIPTGNEMISLPKINENTAGIEDFTYLSMQHKGLIEVRGSKNTPLIMPFIQVGEEEIPLTQMKWCRDHYWIPSLSAKAGDHDFAMTVLTPIGERGFAMKLSFTAKDDADILWGLKGCWDSSWHCINEDKELPAVANGTPLLREHRLYQADWLLRYYGFEANELLSEKQPNFNEFLDPKCDWALRHPEQFPVEINRADYETILRVPGIGVKSAQRIVRARQNGNLSFEDLKKIGVTLKRALYFITCNGKMMYPTKIEEDYITRNLLYEKENLPFLQEGIQYEQLSLFS